MKTLWICAAALFALPCLTGCGGSSSPAVNSPGLVPRSVSAMLSNGLTATLTEDRSTVAVGGTVNYTLTLANPTVLPITYKPALSGTFFSSAPAYLAVTDPAGKLAFPTGVIPQFGGIGPSTTLAPGQSASGSVAVGGSSQGSYSAAGTYMATAAFAAFQGSTDTSSGTEINASPGPLIITVQ